MPDRPEVWCLSQIDPLKRRGPHPLFIREFIANTVSYTVGTPKSRSTDGFLFRGVRTKVPISLFIFITPIAQSIV